MDNIYYENYISPFCKIVLVGNKNGLMILHLDTKRGRYSNFNIKDSWIKKENYFKDVKKELDQYFSGKRRKFNIKLNLIGTDFQKKVWNELKNIPFGELCSYKDIAIKVGNSNSSRAIGMVNSKNPIPIIIPCHRVIGSNGKLTGFSAGLDLKKDLIDMEKKYFKDQS